MRTMKKSKIPAVCDCCGEETFEPYTCPRCERLCCGERCIAGNGVVCFEYEEDDQ